VVWPVVDRASVEVRVVVVLPVDCAGSERRVEVWVDVLVPVDSVDLLVFREERDASDGPITRRLVSTPVLCW
jgi:hypothetical protein